MATHYEVLGVEPGASHDEVRRAYHRQARIHHPDANVAGQAAGVGARRMVAVNAAWEVLGDPDRRRDYDAGLVAASRRATRHGRPEKPPADPAFPDWFEPADTAAVDLEEDTHGSRPPKGAELFVFVPVALVAVAAALFALSMLSQSSALFSASLVLVPVAVAAFFAAPLVAMFTRVRARSRVEPSD